MHLHTPKSLGYRFPAEWEKHCATWLSYPKINGSWPHAIRKVEKAYNSFVKIISQGETVHLIVDNKKKETEVSESLIKIGTDLSKVIFHHFITDDCWTRDHGPTFLIKPDGEKAIVDWEFNAWGNKYPSKKDNEIPSLIAAHKKIRKFSPNIVMEGGSIETNGNGTLLTTASCLFNKNRNPKLSSVQIEEYLQDYYCVDKILWLEEGVAGDDTDGHIDDIARFTDPTTLIMVIEENKKSRNYAPLQHNLKLAGQFRMSNGASPKIVELPMPEYCDVNGELLPASYANFYICNTGVIVPVFNCKNDRKAVDVLSKFFPEKEIIPLDSSAVIHGLGSWHCLSQQEPA